MYLTFFVAALPLLLRAGTGAEITSSSESSGDATLSSSDDSCFFAFFLVGAFFLAGFLFARTGAVAARSALFTSVAFGAINFIASSVS